MIYLVSLIRFKSNIYINLIKTIIHSSLILLLGRFFNKYCHKKAIRLSLSWVDSYAIFILTEPLAYWVFPYVPSYYLILLQLITLILLQKLANHILILPLVNWTSRIRYPLWLEFCRMIQQLYLKIMQLLNPLFLILR